MASVTSLDQDMKRLRMSRYTPAAGRELRAWIEDTLGEQLPSGDVLDILKDGTILCRLANLGLPAPGIKFKKSPMPFIQMENISHFLRACENPPFNLPSHDRFLTVDLYELKDPAQVIQCLGAFSRVAHSLFPARFPSTIGPKRGTALSPTHTGASNSSATSDHASNNAARGLSNPNQATSPPRSTGVSRPMSSAFTGPSSILYSGYMGGASQGNQGVAFGARRQITTPAPYVPSLAEKERKRREKEIEDDKLRILAEEAEAKRKIERAAEEEREKAAEERRWEEESRRLREEEKLRVEKQKREWEEQEKRWKEAEQERLREETDAQSRATKETQRRRGLSDPRLQGQYLSDYQKEEKAKSRQGSRQTSYNDPERFADREKIQDLERQLEEAKERERLYEEERQKRGEKRQQMLARSRSRSRPRLAPRPPSPQDSNVSWTGDEREYLRKASTEYRTNPPPPTSNPVSQAISPPASRPLPDPMNPQKPFSRPLPDPVNHQSPSQHQASAYQPPSHHPAPSSYNPPSHRQPPPSHQIQSQQPMPQQSSFHQPPTQQPPVSRPLPDPSAFAVNPNMNRTERYLAHNQAPLPQQAQTHVPNESSFSSSNEQRGEDTRRVASQTKTKAGGWASKSLLEREMERERERQREWEASQKETQSAPRDANAGTGAGKTWDVNQYGYMGGDSQNRGGGGIGFGAKRQIIGPRPPP